MALGSAYEAAFPMTQAPYNEHRFAHSRSNMGNVLARGFCTAPGCNWTGTVVGFTNHLYEMVPKIGDDRSWRYHRRERGEPA